VFSLVIVSKKNRTSGSEQTGLSGLSLNAAGDSEAKALGNPDDELWDETNGNARPDLNSNREGYSQQRSTQPASPINGTDALAALQAAYTDDLSEQEVTVIEGNEAQEEANAADANSEQKNSGSDFSMTGQHDAHVGNEPPADNNDDTSSGLSETGAEHQGHENNSNQVEDLTVNPGVEEQEQGPSSDNVQQQESTEETAEEPDIVMSNADSVSDGPSDSSSTISSVANSFAEGPGSSDISQRDRKRRRRARRKAKQPKPVIPQPADASPPSLNQVDEANMENTQATVEEEEAEQETAEGSAGNNSMSTEEETGFSADAASETQDDTAGNDTNAAQTPAQSSDQTQV
jgi:hypothetical protein